MTPEQSVQQEGANVARDEDAVNSQYRLDRIYHVVKNSAEEEDDLIISMTVMENPPTGG